MEQRTGSMIHIDHSHRRLTSGVPQSPPASPPGDRRAPEVHGRLTSITPGQPHSSVSSVLSVRNPTHPPGPSSISAGVTCPSLRSPSGARQSPPKGRLRNGLLEESACRRGGERDIDDPCRPLPLKAHVRRSAVSVGFAAGRLTGTRGTWTADVDHFQLSTGSMTPGRTIEG